MPMNKKQALDVADQVMSNHGLPWKAKGFIIAVAMIYHVLPDPVVGPIDDVSVYVPALIAMSAKFNIWVERKLLQFGEWREHRAEQRAQRRFEHQAN